MINRDNYKDVQKFLEYKKEQKCTRKTIGIYDVWLRYALEWCDDTPFPECNKKKEQLQDYLEGLVAQERISEHSAHRICTTFSEFLSYISMDNKVRYSSMKKSYIESIKYKTYADNAKLPPYYTLEEMKKIAAVETDDLTIRRTRAAACLLYLSGMRIGAFLTLPIECLNLEKMQVYQFPEKGVYTKFRKRAITSLLNIHELLDVVKDWDAYIRSVSKSSSTWYPRYENNNLSFKDHRPESKDREEACHDAEKVKRGFYRYLEKLCALADVDYKGAHAFRHGHAHFGLRHAKNPEQMKAVSLNLMHKSTAITDELYSRMNAGDTNQIITTLGLDTSMHTTETAEAIPENLPDYIKIAIKALIDSARAQ